MHQDVVRMVQSLLQREAASFEGDVLVMSSVLSGMQGTPVPFSLSHFKPISPGPSPASSSCIAFVDGGNAELLAAPSLSVHAVRLHASVYQEKKAGKPYHLDGFVIVHAVESDAVPGYEAHVLFSDPKKTGYSVADHFAGSEPSSRPSFSNPLVFSSDDPSLRAGLSLASPSTIVGVVRRYLELWFARKLVQEGHARIMVLDGSLAAKHAQEREMMEGLMSDASARNIPVIGLSKTSDLLTKKGSSVMGLLKHHGPACAWVYHPVLSYPVLSPDSSGSSSSQIEMCFARLHPLASHVVRIDVAGHRISSALPAILPLIIGTLADYSQDPVFFGYPYGLVDADQLARISKAEQQYLQTRLKAAFGAGWKVAERWVSGKDAHGVLDAIRF